MIAHVIHPRLVRVDSHDRERYAVLTALGVWCDDKSGRAVCPVTSAAIHAALKARS